MPGSKEIDAFSHATYLCTYIPHGIPSQTLRVQGQNYPSQLAVQSKSTILGLQYFHLQLGNKLE